MSFGEMQHPSTSDGSYAEDESEVLAAVSAYRSHNEVTYPTVTQIVRVMKSIGWEKTGKHLSKMPINRAAERRRSRMLVS